MCFSGPRKRSEEARRIEEDRAGMDGGQLGWNLMTGEARGGRGNWPALMFSGEAGKGAGHQQDGICSDLQWCVFCLVSLHKEISKRVGLAG